MTASQWSDIAAAFALDALNAEDRAAFDAQLRNDPELQSLVDEYLGVVGAIAEEVEPRTPPVALRERVLSQARRGSVSHSSHSPVDTAPSLDLGPLGSSPWTGRLAMAASIVLLVVLGASTLRLSQRAGGLEDQVADLSGELGALRLQLESAELELVRYDSVAATFIGQSLRFASLSAPDQSPRLHLVHNQDQDLLLVAATNLPPAPEDRVYQLWGIREGEDPVSLGTFDTGAENTALQALVFDGAEEFDLGAVTEEPAGGSLQPTTTPFLVGGWTGGAT